MIRTPWWFALILSVHAIALALSTDGDLAREVFARVALALIGLNLLWLGLAKERRDHERSER